MEDIINGEKMEDGDVYDTYADIEDEIIDYDGELDLDSEGEEEEDNETIFSEPNYPANAEEKISWQEQIRMIHLRSHLNELDEKVQSCTYTTEKTREELKKCQNQIEQLEKERDNTFTQIENAEASNNTAAVYRLRSVHDRLCRELEDEEELKENIEKRLEQTEYELWKAEVEKGKFLLAEDELKYKEQQLFREKTDHAIRRLNKEEKSAIQAEGKLKKLDKQQTEMMIEQRQRHKLAMEESRKSHQRASKYLTATLVKLKKEEQDKHSDYKADMQRKIDMLLKLKKDIVSNRENMKAIKARDRAQEREKKIREELERQRILQEGGNADELMLIKKRKNEFEKQKQKFEADQKLKQADIMKKVLSEESRMEKRKREQSYLWSETKKDKEKFVPVHKKKPLKCLEDFSRAALESAGLAGSGDFQQADKTQGMSYSINVKYEDEERDDDEDDVDDEFGQKAVYLSSEPTIVQPPDSSDSETDDVQEDAVSLAKPEFEGLWDTHKPYHVPKDMDTQIKLPGASKMEKDIMMKVLDKHRDGITIKQVAAGREFTGCPFYSKPDIIHFKNFDVGQTYKKKVTLTNVSYTVNYCKYVSITEKLKDFIKIDFDPPGQMSAGLTCDMMVTFKPMINEDLVGQVNFLSQTGPFSIPLRCSTKKCDVQVDTNLADFGVTVIGETLKRTVTLTNKGAMATKFDFFKVTGMKHGTCTTAETSLGRLTSDTMRALSPDSSDQKLSDPKQKIESLEKIAEISPELSSPTGGLDVAGTVNGGSKVGDDISPRQPDSDEYHKPPEPEPSPEFAFSEMEDYGTVDGMKVGSVVSGEIKAFSSIKLEIIWQPTVPGAVDSEFLISFSDPLSEGISIHSVAKAIDVPVWVERQNVDLKICMFDRLYQDTIVVNNRATTALRLKFEVCKDLENHLELLPKTGYIQAQSQFSAQLKFLPRPSLLKESCKYFDKETGVLEAPMTIRVADQTQPVTFTVCAVVTNSDIEFDVSNIDFGFSTIYESVKKSIKVTNKSILPQQFGFLGLPEHVEVQPNDGFGTLLPLETIDLDVIFSPDKARDYKFDLVCKSLINRDFKIHCKGVGVHPPLELSHQVVNFAATSVYDVSTAALHVINSHTSSNEFTHPVPRIGKGEIAPVGPTSFEFVLPSDCPLTISPSVGTVMPGKKCRVQIRFSPKLKEEAVRKEAVKMAVKQMEAQAQREYDEAVRKEVELQEQAQIAAMKKAPKGKSSPKGKGKASAGTTGTTSSTLQKPKPVVAPEPDTITTDSSAYSEAIGSLLRQFKGKFETYTIPCYIGSGSCGDPGSLPYSINNTIYVEVHCPTIKPPVVILSDSGRNTINFGEVSIGQSVSRSVTMQNISNKTVELNSSLLDTDGPFLMLNALRVLPPGGTHTAVLSFAPNKGCVFQEVLSINSMTALLSMTLIGKGVSPIVNLSLESDVLDMGAVLATEYCERTFKIHNTSSLSIDYVIKLDSLSLLRHAKSQHLPAFIKRDKKNKSYVGTQNNNGQNVFDLVPSEGTIPAGGTKEVTVTFAPDHGSEHYSDGVRIELFGQEESHFFELLGIAKNHIMYMYGGDELTPDIESLAVTPVLDDDEDFKLPPKPILVSLFSITKDNEFTTASREIFVACVRTMAVSQKKNGEFQFENIQTLQAKGFNMEPQRGMIEAGTKKSIMLTWTPPPGHEPNQTMEASVLVTLKGDVTEQYRVMLRGMVVSE
ncbi:cilia- and flagella-associated protein 74 isoform X1 [Patella vulgata]|uniref:cilia- and flagella-associated protein 74 isoform X1 n=2 Tax=Patella vulgata TaxID=6465 RepID=UPI0024A9A0AA|nr:cilia- and flagella-associated protein 74 isoform X1 [Patella vulgata]